MPLFGPIGRICVGLEAGELERFATYPDARKVGPRDLAACAMAKELGATTVGATLAVCRAAGIGFMGTGGIGGVHRGWSQSMDISADLGELGRTEALVVASGAKSILDVDATAEVLETLGVPVLGWRTDELPLFYRADGGPLPGPRTRVVAVGAVADLVVLDPAKVADRATFDEPRLPPVGIEHVLVSGVAVVSGGRPTSARPGRMIAAG